MIFLELQFLILWWFTQQQIEVFLYYQSKVNKVEKVLKDFNKDQAEKYLNGVLFFYDEKQNKLLTDLDSVITDFSKII